MTKGKTGGGRGNGKAGRISKKDIKFARQQAAREGSKDIKR